ncbi:AMP-dependent synthetase [Bacteroidota bacterium]|nr:AMP-dependent synthetase [Bacteroidota bacterium]
MELKRIFDIPEYQKKKYPKSDALNAKENGQWRAYNIDECINNINHVSFALLASGIKKDDKISIISNNRPEWNFVDFGVMQVGAVNVPVYPTITEEDYVFIFNDAEVKMVFVSSEELFLKIQNIKSRIPSLKEVFTFNQVKGASHFSEFMERGKNGSVTELEKIKSEITSDDISTIIYTSGTTGFPKGVMLSHWNVLSDVIAAKPLMPVGEKDKALSFLPLNHSFEKMISYLYLCYGISIYYAESMDTIGDNLREVKPQIMTCVPRLLEKVYEKILSKGQEQKGIKRALFFWALALGERWDNQKSNGIFYHIQLAIANKLVFSKWRAALGGQLKCVVTGAAPMQHKLLRIFTAAKIVIMEGYGLTETSPAISVSRFNLDENVIGCVGPAIPGVEIKIAEDGEILCRGAIVMKGYYKRPDLTAEVIDKDGWLHTGDIGELVNGKFLKITDRKKELFKTSGGKYVAPQPIENKFKEELLIEQMMVIGASRKFPSALIVPAANNLKAWCSQHGINFTNTSEMIRNEDVKKKFEQVVEENNKLFGHSEQIKKFTLVPNEWTIADGELTPTLKLKRKIIEKKFEKEIEAMYAE